MRPPLEEGEGRGVREELEAEAKRLRESVKALEVSKAELTARCSALEELAARAAALEKELHVAEEAVSKLKKPRSRKDWAAWLLLFALGLGLAAGWYLAQLGGPAPALQPPPWPP